MAARQSREREPLLPSSRTESGLDRGNRDEENGEGSVQKEDKGTAISPGRFGTPQGRENADGNGSGNAGASSSSSSMAAPADTMVQRRVSVSRLVCSQLFMFAYGLWISSYAIVTLPAESVRMFSHAHDVALAGFLAIAGGTYVALCVCMAPAVHSLASCILSIRNSCMLHLSVLLLNSIRSRFRTAPPRHHHHQSLNSRDRLPASSVIERGQQLAGDDRILCSADSLCSQVCSCSGTREPTQTPSRALESTCSPSAFLCSH